MACEYYLSKGFWELNIVYLIGFSFNCLFFSNAGQMVDDVNFRKQPLSSSGVAREIGF